MHKRKPFFQTIITYLFGYPLDRLVDFINGAIVRLGAEHGVPTPVNNTLAAAVKALESHYLA